MKFYSYLVLSILIIVNLASCSDDDNLILPSAREINSEMIMGSVMTNFLENADFILAVNAHENDLLNTDNQPDNNSESDETPACATVNVIDGLADGFPVTLEYDFGSGCTGAFGYTRTGKINLTFYENFYENGGWIQIVRGENYTVNGFSLSGTVTYTNRTSNVAMPTWERKITDGVIQGTGGIDFKYSSDLLVRLTEGSGDLNLENDYYSILSGNWNIENTEGNALVSTVETPLVIPYSCEHFIQGSLVLLGGTLNGTLDYGNGNCDNEATYTHETGQVFNVLL